MNNFRRFIRKQANEKKLLCSYTVYKTTQKISQDRRVVTLDYTLIGIVKPLDMFGILHRYDRLFYAK